MSEDKDVVYIGYALHDLQRCRPDSCESDMRLVWRKDDEGSLGITHIEEGEFYKDVVELPRFCGSREMRLLAFQLLSYADELDEANRPEPHVLARRRK
jgi:hypothetical protein